MVAFLPDGQRLVIGSSDGTIRMWNLASGTLSKEGKEIIHATDVHCFAVTSDGRQIISGDKHGRITVWDTDTLKLVQEWKHTEERLELAISADNRLVAYGFMTIVIRELNSGRITYETTGHFGAWVLCFSPDASKLACGWHENILFYDVDASRQTHTLEGHGDWVYSLHWSRNGTRLYSSGGKTIRCWDTTTWKQAEAPWAGHTHDINSISLSPDGTKVASGSDDKTVRFWDACYGHPFGHPLQHPQAVSAVSISPLNDVVATATYDGKIYVWLAPWCNDDQSNRYTRPSALPISSNLSETTTPSFMHTHMPRNVPDVFHTHDLPQVSQYASQPPLVLRPHIAGIPSQTTSSPIVVPRKTLDGNRQNPFCEAIGKELRNVVSPQTGPAITSQVTSTPPPVSPSEYDRGTLTPFPAPPDLTQYIVKLTELYTEGGGFGDVYRCHYNSPIGVIVIVAVKSFRFKLALEEGRDTAHAVKMVRRELGIWRRSNHPNVVPFLGTATGFGMQGSLSLVSERMPNGTLHKFLAMHGEQLHVSHQLQLLLDIANGLDYLHSFPNTPITHGDLNGNNVLVDANFAARLVDFGLSSFIGIIPEGLTYLAESTARPGTLRWTAPEQLKPGYKRSSKSDIYAFGCITLQMFSGEKPWADVPEDVSVILRLAMGETPARPASRPIDDRHWELIESCWKSVDERPTARVLISSLRDLLSSCPHSKPLCELVIPFTSENDPVSTLDSALLSPPLPLSANDEVSENGRQKGFNLN